MPLRKRIHTPDTPAVRAIEFIKRYHPKMYQGLVINRPELIAEAYAKPLNGIAGVDGIFDDILNFGQKSLDLYKQQQTFKAQLTQAAQTPVRTIQTQPAQVAPLSPQFDPYTEAKIRTTKTVFGSLIPVLVIGGLGALFLLMRGKKRR